MQAPAEREENNGVTGTGGLTIDSITVG